MDKNFEEDAIALRDAMKGMGTNEEVIIQITANRSNEERQEIRSAYKSSFGNDLIQDLNSELGGDFKKVVVGMYMSPIEYDVTELYNAFKGAGTDEDAVSEIIGSRSNARLTQVKELYELMHGESLEKRVKDECSGDYEKLLISLLQCQRSEDDNVVYGDAMNDAEALYKAGEGKWGTDEETFNRIFAMRSAAHLCSVNKLYVGMNQKDLLKVVDSEFSGDMRVLLKTVLHSHINPADYYAHRIYKACKGFGTNDKQLIRALVTIDETVLVQVKGIFAQKFSKSLRALIEDETSGDYRKMLVELIKN